MAMKFGGLISFPGMFLLRSAASGYDVAWHELRHDIEMVAILDPPSWISGFTQDFRKSQKLTMSSRSIGKSD